MLASAREWLVGRRTQVAHALCGHAAEFGLRRPRARPPSRRCWPSCRPTRPCRAGPRTMLAGLAEGGAHIEARLAAVPGVGSVAASLLVMKIPGPHAFGSTRRRAEPGWGGSPAPATGRGAACGWWGRPRPSGTPAPAAGSTRPGRTDAPRPASARCSRPSRSLIAPPLSTASCSLPLLSLPYQDHGSLRGRRVPPQHLVRSTGAAMSTTGSRAPHTAQRPPSQPACTLAPVGNSHPRQHVARVDLVKVWSGTRGLLRPAERLA